MNQLSATPAAIAEKSTLFEVPRFQTLGRGLALSAFCVALVGGLGWQWRDWPPPPEGVAPPENAGDISSTAPAFDLPNEDGSISPVKDENAAISNILERPLFRPDRKPEPAPEMPSAPSENVTVNAAELEALDLTAVLLTPTQLSAWVRDSSQPAARRVRIDDTIKGWTVREIAEDHIVLALQDEEYQLILRDYQKQPPPPVATPAPPKPPTAAPRTQQPPRPGRPSEPPVPERRPVK